MFQGACGEGKSVKNCADLSGASFKSVDRVPELQLLKDKDGGSVELIVGKSADGSELEAKGVFRGCAIKY